MLEYVPPHPARGSNLHRYVFVLFEQKEPTIRVENAPTLADRFRSTKDFAEKYALKPVSFAFFRSQWDTSVSDVYKEVLKTKEPIWKELPASRPGTSSLSVAAALRARGRKKRQN